MGKARSKILPAREAEKGGEKFSHPEANPCPCESTPRALGSSASELLNPPRQPGNGAEGWSSVE